MGRTPAMLIGALAGGYAVGSLPVAWLTVRARHGVDLRRAGRGGTGAIDALAVAGMRTAVLAALLELAKGAAVGVGARLYDSEPWFVALAIAGCVAGDAFPAGFRRGGRGVIPLLSGLLVALPVAWIAAAIVALVVIAFTSRRLSAYEAGVGAGVPVGLVVGTGDVRTLAAAAIIVAAILGRRAQRMHAREAGLAVRRASSVHARVVDAELPGPPPPRPG